MLRTSVDHISGKVFYLALTALPLTAGLVYAALYSLGLSGVLATGFTLDHWAAVLGDTRFYASLAYSLWIAAVTIALSTSASLFLAIRYRLLWNNKGWEWGLYVPLAFPAIVAAFTGFQLLGRSGLFSRMAYRLGWINELGAFPELIQEPFGIGIIAVHSLMAIPFLTLYWHSVYEKDALENFRQLALTLGATNYHALRKVIIPILLKRGWPILVLYGIFIAGAYEAPLLLGTQRPQMITLFIVNKINRFDLGERPEAYAALLLVIVALVLLLFAAFGRSTKKERVW